VPQKDSVIGDRTDRAAGDSRAWLAAGLAAATLAACTPTVAVQAPKEPITINLNIDADIRVRVERQAEEDIEQNPDIF
jgi:hypothetical protein